MAYEEQLQSISVAAGADLSEKQYRFMTINSSGELAATGDGLKADGVLQNKPDAQGRTGALGISGVSKLEAGAAITAGDDLAPDSVGRGVTASVTGDVVAARALEDASGAGSIIAVLLVLQKEPAA